MRQSLLIKLPTLLAAGLCLALLRAPLSWAMAALSFGVGTAVLLYLVFDPNATLWAPTLWRSPRPTNAVALTFDDGPDPEFTPRILSILAEKKVPAAFFVVGQRVLEHPEIVAAIDRAGHLVADHSHTHDLRFHFRLWSGARREIAACNLAIVHAIGREPRLFRSPQGFKNPALGDVLQEKGMIAIGWQVRGLDTIARDADAIVTRIVSGARPGGVIALHDGGGLLGTSSREPTIEALPKVIDALRAEGMEFARLDELLRVEAYRAPGEGKLS
jgi:peptidoglycan/xylan/chitin deacetylase (PgdA/CDA1 family)